MRGRQSSALQKSIDSQRRTLTCHGLRSIVDRRSTIFGVIEMPSRSRLAILNQDAGAAPGPPDEELSRLAWAIAHPARVRILRILKERASCVCGELVEAMPLAQSTVSQHLKILKQAGLVQGEIEGPKVCYCLAPDAIRRLKELVAAL
jgi:ArsR family transcriptional regulator, arsenate/arsenite/antimonite-responsive transcriptional repressor